VCWCRQRRDRPSAKQEIDYGRRAEGYIFGAFCPATGEAFTHPCPGRGAAQWVDCLEHVEQDLVDAAALHSDGLRLM